MNIRTRLVGAFLALATITLLCGAAGFFFVHKVGNDGLLVGEHNAPLVDAVMEAKLLATEAHLKFEEIMGGDDAESIESVRQRMADARWYIVAIAEGGQNEEGHFFPITQPEGRFLQAKALEQFDRLSEALDKRYASRGQNLSEASFHAIDAEFDATFDSFITEIDKLETAIQTEVAQALDHLRGAIDESNITLGVLVAIAVIAGLILGQITTRAITTPLSECVDLAKRIEHGDLTASLDIRRNDEIGQLMHSLDGMRSGLSTMIARLRDNINDLNRSAKVLEASAGSSEQASTEQSDAATHMAASVEQLSVSIDHLGERAHDANEVSKASSSQLDESGKIIQNAADEMRTIAGAVTETAKTISELEGYSDQISSIVGVIRAIADQTNLLALNAAIEAARAGEQGRGFAVVADEVRDLAERTANSTREITDTIEKIQHGTHRAVEDMRSGVTKVDEGVKLTQAAGASVSTIRQGADQVANSVADITSILVEQSGATRDIAASIERVASSAEQSRTMVVETARSARSLADMSRTLEEMVSGFRIDR
ncbi:methyl-accepting chemotaxis protein [Nitrogeniibacter aestuarii]|uniref:methyl-accepting chemotaxis protein n=1 Tax=Nitrogeniibacter aestuarii TaxID=2815343 RepID=UPI001E2EC723|nr:methyl-accepting chemotaxis protein [Nitrogeniibacter aestuarii]